MIKILQNQQMTSKRKNFKLKEIKYCQQGRNIGEL